MNGIQINSYVRNGEDMIYFFSSNSFFFHTKYSGGKEIPGYEYFLWLRKADQPSEILHHPSEGILLTGYQLDTNWIRWLDIALHGEPKEISGIQVVSRWYPGGIQLGWWSGGEQGELLPPLPPTQSKEE
jgi:hypothetical protein